MRVQSIRFENQGRTATVGILGEDIVVTIHEDQDIIAQDRFPKTEKKKAIHFAAEMLRTNDESLSLVERLS